MRSLAAFTERRGPFPPFVSINETDKGVSFFIREPARDAKLPAGGAYKVQGNTAGVVLPHDIALRMLREATVELERLMAHGSARKH